MGWLMFLLASSVVLTAWMTGLLRRYALDTGILDRPNQRSSHSQPTPRGGGLAVVVASIVAIGVLHAWRIVPASLFIALGGGGIAVATVGFLDDRRPLPARIRLLVHLAAALWALAWLGGFPPLPIGGQLMSLGWAGDLLGMLGIVWVLNLFNFMDGIDGIAASETIFVTWGAGMLGLAWGASVAVPAAASMVGAACCGFLLWNWPPARIFMGDVGSGYLGYAIAVLALAAAKDNPVALGVWLIMGGVFFVDSTVTLVRRTLRGERVHEAHRSHAYQWLARRWGSHRRVTVAVMAVNLLWLLPWALLATLYARFVAWIVVAALAPLVAVALAAGSGRAEPTHR
jgi:Fuc2NAc and GlcNAc transferase